MRVPRDPLAVYFQPIAIRESVPGVRIPLRKADDPVLLAIQPLIDSAYTNGRYDRTIDYTRPPDPPLEADDAAWADDLLRRAGKR
jgi:hypothetical protein